MYHVAAIGILSARDIGKTFCGYAEVFNVSGLALLGSAQLKLGQNAVVVQTQCVVDHADTALRTQEVENALVIEAGGIAAAHVNAQRDEVDNGIFSVGEQKQREDIAVVENLYKAVQTVLAVLKTEGELAGLLYLGAVEIGRAQRSGTAEADVADAAGAVGQSDDGGAVTGGGEVALKQNADGNGRALEAESLKQRHEQSVDLKAEAASAFYNDLLKQSGYLKRDLLVQIENVKRFKGDGHQVRLDQLIQRLLDVGCAERGGGVGQLRVQ